MKEPKTIFGITKVTFASMFYIFIGIRQEVFQDILIDALVVVVTSVCCHACGGSSYDVFPILIKKCHFMAHTTTDLDVGKGILRTWYFRNTCEHNTSESVSCDPYFMEHLEHNTQI